MLVRHRAEEHDRVEIRVRIEPGESQSGEDGRADAHGRSHGGTVHDEHPHRADRALRGERPVGQEERRTHQPHHHDDLRQGRDQGADAGDPGADQQRVADGADHDHGHDDPGHAGQPDPEHVGVLGADGDDEGETRAEADEGGGEDGGELHVDDAKARWAIPPGHDRDAA
nr:hypothetical protein GCM10025699_51690 [Microbacterium flavescens]